MKTRFEDLTGLQTVAMAAMPPLSLLLESDPLAKGGPKCAHSFAEKNAAHTFMRRGDPLALCERFTLQHTLIPDGERGQKMVQIIWSTQM